MHATQLLDKAIAKRCQAVHRKRWWALMANVGALLRGKRLSVTGLGRALQSNGYEKHNIKRSDRLVGNVHLHRDRKRIYGALAHRIVGKQRQPVILVDWSDLSADREFQLLRASVAVGGRALTLYEETHPQCYAGNARVHRRFLATLQAILPAGCCPIIVTDAGFRTPWFKAVLARGWEFVGRIGGHTMLNPQGEAAWIRVESVFESATRRPRYLGHIDVVKRDPLPCHAYVVKKKKQGRIKKTVFGKRCMMKHSEKNAQRERTPWLIVTSLSGGASITQRVMHLYKTRMQIEEAFRDIKNSRWGFSLDDARVSSSYRYDNLLLIGSLANLAVWLTGLVAEMKQLHHRFQANTVRTHKVLSTFYLGCRVLDKGIVFRQHDYLNAMRTLNQHVAAQSYG